MEGGSGKNFTVASIELRKLGFRETVSGKKFQGTGTLLSLPILKRKINNDLKLLCAYLFAKCK